MVRGFPFRHAWATGRLAHQSASLAPHFHHNPDLKLPTTANTRTRWAKGAPCLADAIWDSSSTSAVGADEHRRHFKQGATEGFGAPSQCNDDGARLLVWAGVSRAQRHLFPGQILSAERWRSSPLPDIFPNTHSSTGFHNHSGPDTTSTHTTIPLNLLTTALVVALKSPEGGESGEEMQNSLVSRRYSERLQPS